MRKEIAFLVLLSFILSCIWGCAQSHSLHVAVNTNDFKGVQSLINKGHDVNELRTSCEFMNKRMQDCSENQETVPLLYLTIYHNNADIAKLLIDNGADVNLKTEKGMNVLLMASLIERLDIVKLLIDNGADVDIKTEYGSTPLHAALKLGHFAKTRGGQSKFFDIARLLIRNGAKDVNTKDEDGTTPLFLALYSEQFAIAKSLVDLGANVNAKAKDGQTPLDYAKSIGHTAMINLLIENGAENNH